MEMDYTRKFSIQYEKDPEIKEILTSVYQSLQEKGYNPINQIVGYILSEDPTYITNYNNARALIRKLEGLASSHQARQLQRQVYVSGRVKAMNESIYYNVDKLHTALSARKSITFRYFDYDMHRNKVFRREGRRYAVSPYGLIWNSENYYLVAYDISNQEMRHYRVDKMAEIVVTGLPREGEDRYPDFDVAAYGQKHFGMYSGEEASVTLRCRSHMAGVVWDRFGQDVILVPEDEDHFTVTLPLVLSPQFFGWLFGLEDNVELIAPQKAAEEYRRKLKAVLEQYG